jgi:hypothetical protein
MCHDQPTLSASSADWQDGWCAGVLLQLVAHSLLFAVVNVLLSTLGFIPVMLYAPSLHLARSGWTVMDAALLGAMLGSTDAVAVSAILKAGVRADRTEPGLCVRRARMCVCGRGRPRAEGVVLWLSSRPFRAGADADPRSRLRDPRGGPCMLPALALHGLLFPANHVSMCFLSKQNRLRPA